MSKEAAPSNAVLTKRLQAPMNDVKSAHAPAAPDSISRTSTPGLSVADSDEASAQSLSTATYSRTVPSTRHEKQTLYSPTVDTISSGAEYATEHGLYPTNVSKFKERVAVPPLNDPFSDTEQVDSGPLTLEPTPLAESESSHSGTAFGEPAFSFDQLHERLSMPPEGLDPVGHDAGVQIDLGKSRPERDLRAPCLALEAPIDARRGSGSATGFKGDASQSPAVYANTVTHEQSLRALEHLVHQRACQPRAITTASELKRSKRSLAATKTLFATSQISINGLLIFATWWWSSYWYIYLPFITITVALNCFMVISVLLHKLLRSIIPEKKHAPDEPESLVYILPCYNETKDECTRSLDSLVNQVNIDKHKRAIVIICDGRVRGKGMDKTCADYLLEDILIHRTERKVLSGAYTAWNTEQNNITMQKGSYKGVPYMCLVKNRNLGKRDGLILIRSFLYVYNERKTRPQCIFRPRFFAEMAHFLEHEAAISNVSFLCGMDADTVFADDCVSHLLEESRYKNTVGVCGYVAVDFSGGRWSLWSLYQSTEYTISQALRRLHQSVATHKVSCLPGCCQLLRICEATCGDEVLLERFGYFPYARDGMLKQIRATASEDRNHVCLMLSTRPKSQTRQALRAKAYTDVPQDWSVFLSQRRRWTLGATSNDLLLVFAPGVNWFERILALANVITWYLNPFILASIASFVVACTHVEWWIVLAFASVMIFPLLYYVAIVIWLPTGVRARVQYLLGLACYVFLGPFLNITVLVYALWNMDNFGWGKTRKVVNDEADEKLTPRRGEQMINELDREKEHEPPHHEPMGTQAVAGQIEHPPPARTRDDFDEERAIGGS